MKKSISIILTGICILGLVGCGANKSSNTNTSKNQIVEEKQNAPLNNTSTSEKQESDNSDEKLNTNPLIGEWSDVNKGTIIEFTEDGNFLRAGDKISTYEIIDEDTVKLHNNDDEIIDVKYEIDGDTLKWGTNFEQPQEFTKTTSIKPVG